jgi:hypothetical protein
MAKITQQQLSKIVKRRAKIAAAQAELDALEQSLKEQLRAGSTLAKGLLYAELKKWDRRSPAWREIVEREIDAIRGKGEGFKFAERVLASTTPSPCEKLVVELVK